jgi:uncharacterized protein DUF5317
MRLMLLVIVSGLIAGWMIGGRLDRLAQAGVRWPAIALVGLALQLAPLPGKAALWLLYGSFALLLAFAAVNVRRPGFALVLLGLVLNLTVITTNAGMPVAEKAIVASGQQDTMGELLRNGDGIKHHLAGAHTRLLALGDVIAVPQPIRQVISLGDIVVDVGLLWFIVGAMRGGRLEAAGRDRAPLHRARRRRHGPTTALRITPNGDQPHRQPESDIPGTP